MRNLIIGILSQVILVLTLPEQGKWTLETNLGHEYVGVSKTLFKGSEIKVSVSCDPGSSDTDTYINIAWFLRKSPCWKPVGSFAQNESIWFPKLFNSVDTSLNISGTMHFAPSVKFQAGKYLCGNHFIILDFKDVKTLLSTKMDEIAMRNQANINDLVSEDPAEKKIVKRATLPTEGTTDPSLKDSTSSVIGSSLSKTNHTITTAPADGIYLLIVHTTSDKAYNAKIHIEMGDSNGYLSAADRPLLGFYCAMCVVYVIYGIVWLIVCFMRWRELLRVQYWIGAVIFLGMLEKAMYTAEYESLNQSGVSNRGLIIAAEIVTCAKRTLARMLVIIVSLGFGVVKPRLGIILHRVVGLGVLYFILATIESCNEALKPVTDFSNEALITTIPLALLDAAICWWVFSALVQTTRTLRLRRNTVKLNIFQHLTNTLAFAVLASVIFRIYVIKFQNWDLCLSDWKELWVNKAFWHVLFALILMVIMILWRPTNNNQRFAFSLLLDDGDEEDEEEDNEKFLNEVCDTMKQRKQSTSSSPRESRSVEDDLKWVEENIPSSLADAALPILDSDEEILTAKFEISKMQ